MQSAPTRKRKGKDLEEPSQCSTHGFPCHVCGKTFQRINSLRSHTDSCVRDQHQRALEENTAGFTAGFSEGSSSNTARSSTNTCINDDDNQTLVNKTLGLWASCRVHKHVPRYTMQLIKVQFQELLEHTKRQVADKIRGTGVEESVGEVLQNVSDALAHACCRDSELEYVDSSDAYLKPQRRHLGTDKNGQEHYAYDMDALETLRLLLKYKPNVWQDVKTSLDRWLGGIRTSAEYDPSWVLEDTSHGYEFGRWLLQIQFMDEKDIPLAFIIYYDGLEVVNGLGQARGRHKLACFYWALINVNQMDRFHNINLMTVCLEKDLSLFGASVAISGQADEDMATSTCWAAQMQRLEAGVLKETPEGIRRFVGGTAILAADTPAAAELVGTKRSVGPSTKSICRNCHCAQHGAPPPYKAANSFLVGLPGWACHCKGRSCKYSLRSQADLAAYVGKLVQLRLKRITRTQLASWLQDQGVNTFHGALTGVPLWNMFTGSPMDAMHVVLEGVSRNLLAALWFFMVRKWGVAENTLVDAINAYAKRHSMRRGTFAHLTDARREHMRGGRDDGLPHSDCAFPGTAAQIMHLVLAASEIFLPHIPAHTREKEVWPCLEQHILAVEIILKRSITINDVVELDKHIWYQDTLMLLSPHLKHLWKPKNHYLSHLPLEILQWGPPRLYWCMLFEHENQQFKRAAMHSNFANVLWSCANSKARGLCLELLHNKPRDVQPSGEQIMSELLELEVERWMAQEAFRYGVGF